MSTPSKLIVKLTVPSGALAKLKTSDSPGQQRKGPRGKAAAAAAAAAASSQADVKPAVDASADNASDSNATPAPATNGDGSMLAPPTTLKRKGVPGPKPGHKRMPPAISIDGVPKPRGKPGPKKRKVDGEPGSSLAVPAHKLGPKANQGAINAGLRALDRSGKPCRKWNRQGFTVKSFTGVVWGLPSWHGLANPADSMQTNGDDESSDQRNDLPSSAVGSEDKSNSGNDSGAVAHADIASSPMPEIKADTPMMGA